MKILIPKDTALRILAERKREIYNTSFNATVWKNRTILDLKQIFGEYSDQVSQVSNISFETVVTSLRREVLLNAKLEAEGLLQSYIELIHEYSAIAEKQKQTNEQKFEVQNFKLVNELESQGKQHHELLQLYNSLKKENDNLKNQLQSAEIKNQHLIDNTLQLENITLNRLLKAIKNLPAKQVWGFNWCFGWVVSGCLLLRKVY